MDWLRGTSRKDYLKGGKESGYRDRPYAKDFEAILKFCCAVFINATSLKFLIRPRQPDLQKAHKSRCNGNSNDKNIAPEDSFEGMVESAKEKKFPFAYLYDESQEIARAYGATRTPHIYVVKKEGKDLVVKYVGAIDDNTDDANAVTKKYLENAMDEIIAGKEVSTNFTKAVGCTIKWKGTK